MMSHFSPFPIDTPALRVQGLGVQEIMRPIYFDRQRGWPQFLFVIFYDAANCDTHSSRFQAVPGTLVCWRPGTPHGLGNIARPWNHSWLSVSGTDVVRTLRQTRFPLDKPIPIYDLSFFDTALAELYAELSRSTQSRDPIDLQLARSYVVNIIRRLARALRPVPTAARVRPELLELRQYIDSHFNQPLLLPDLAQRVGLSVSQLCFLHQRHFGASVMAYLRLVRFQRGALLLRDTQLKVRTIAEMVGYPNHFHFTKAFSRQFGKSPASFRRAH